MNAESGQAERIKQSALPRVLFAVLPLLAAVGPLASLYRGLFAFRLVCVLLVAHAILFLIGRSPWRGPDAWLFATTIAMGVAGLLGLVTVRPGSDNPYSEFLSIVLGLSTALAGRAWQRRYSQLYVSLCRGWVVAGIVVCLAAAWEVVTGQHLPGHLKSAGSQPSVAFGNPNALAVFVVMAIVWTMPVRRDGGPVWGAASWSLWLMTVPVLIVTDARLALAMWIVLFAWSVWRAVRLTNTGLMALLAALVPMGVSIVAVVAAPRLLSYVDELSTGGSSGSVRAALTNEGLQIAAQLRGLPGGPGSFEAFMGDSEALDRAGGLVNAHNVWVEILVQYGALCLVLFLGWLAACGVAGSGARDEVVPAVVTLLVLGLVDSSLLDDASLWVFVLTLAMASRTEVVSPDSADARRRTRVVPM